MAIFSLTKKADYGLSLLAHLSEKGRGGRVSLAEMEKRGMPRPFMAQIANSLVVAGILNSKEGRGGGYALNYDPSTIQVKEALEAIEGSDVAPVSCVASPGSCPVEKSCGQRSFMGMFTSQIEKMLESYSLADLTISKNVAK